MCRIKKTIKSLPSPDDRILFLTSLIQTDRTSTIIKAFLLKERGVVYTKQRNLEAANLDITGAIAIAEPLQSTPGQELTSAAYLVRAYTHRSEGMAKTTYIAAVNQDCDQATKLAPPSPIGDLIKAEALSVSVTAMASARA